MGMARFYAGFAAGYVLGARAGRERYQQLVEAWHSLANQPTVTRLREELDAKLAELQGTPPVPPSASSVVPFPGSVPEPPVSRPPTIEPPLTSPAVTGPPLTSPTTSEPFAVIDEPPGPRAVG